MPTVTSERFAHPALFYRDSDEYLAGTVGFLRAALDAGEPAAVAVPGQRLELIRDALGPRASDVYMVDMTGIGRNPGRILPNVLLSFATARAGAPVRIIGEPIWAGRSEDEYPACVQHEALINLAFAGLDATILCPYDVTRLALGVIADAARTHPVVIDSAGERPSPGYAPDAVVEAANLPLESPGNRANSAQFMFSADNLPQTRAYAMAHAHRLGLPSSRRSDLESAVAELANNSVLHGGGRGVLELWAADGYVVGQVRDAGTMTDPLAGRRPVPPGAIAGRGLFLVNHLADLVRTHTAPDSTTVRVYFRIAEPG